MKNNHNNYQLVCGMEIHAELKTKSKMFCGCKNDPFGAEKPNIHTCPVCLGLPGALPVPNKKAIEWTIKLGLALNCKINLFSKFDRKHYFYPDLPKGYQISQYDLPFCYEGYIDTSEGRVRITRIHLEEDTAKLVHKDVNGKKVSLIDFNRSSVPLIEIVTEPDIKSASQAKEYAKKLRQIIRFINIGDCDMEQGGMRLEANVSLKPVILEGVKRPIESGESKQPDPIATLQDDNLPNYKVELKNINSFRFLEQAIEQEIERQSEILDSGKTPIQETRGFNQKTGKTFTQRTKESAEDYRYFPDPDIPPIQLTESDIERLRAELPLLPEQLVETWKNEYEIETRFGKELIKLAKKIELIQKLFKAAKEKDLDCNKLASLIVNKKIDLAAEDPILQFTKLTQTDNVDESEVKNAVLEVIAENPQEAERFKNGEKKLLNFFIGQTMRKIKKKIDTKILVQQINQALST